MVNGVVFLGAVSGKHGVDDWVARCSFMCVLDFAIWRSFFVCVFDGLRSGQKEDEEFFSETYQSTGEQRKEQDTTSQKWKKLLLRSGQSYF